MDRSITKTNTVDIKDESKVCMIDMGKLTQVRYMSGHNRIARVKRVDKDHYINLKTHEVKEYKKREVKFRTDNYASLRRTFSTAKQMINANFRDKNHTTWATLTYNSKVKDDKQIQKDFSNFIKTIRRKYPDNNVKYFSALEFSANEGMHIHVLLYWDNPIGDSINDVISKAWKLGNAYVKELNKDNDIKNIGAYLTAYLIDMPVEEYLSAFQFESIPSGMIKNMYTSKRDGELKQYIKHARLKLYRAGFKIFRHSLGMKQATKEYDSYGAVKKKIALQNKTCVHTAAIRVTNHRNLDILVQYETYQ